MIPEDMKKRNGRCILKKNLHAHLSDQRIRMNYPYLGKADGFTTSLRHQFQERYIGIELELNQELLVKEEFGKNLNKALYTSLHENLGG